MYTYNILYILVRKVEVGKNSQVLLWGRALLPFNVASRFSYQLGGQTDHDGTVRTDKCMWTDTEWSDSQAKLICGITGNQWVLEYIPQCTRWERGIQFRSQTNGSDSSVWNRPSVHPFGVWESTRLTRWTSESSHWGNCADHCPTVTDSEQLIKFWYFHLHFTTDYPSHSWLKMYSSRSVDKGRDWLPGHHGEVKGQRINKSE